MDQGRYPVGLEKLVPDYLDQIPLDPFDGKPIRYVVSEDGFMLYSIGEDQVDNGGKSKQRVGRGMDHDWPFRVHYQLQEENELDSETEKSQ